MELIPILEEEPKEKIEQKTDVILRNAMTLVIKDDDEFQLAAEILKQIKTIQKEIDEYFDPAIKKAHEAHKAILNTKKRQSEPLKKAEKILKNKIAEYHTEQEKRRLEEERKKREELLKQEEEKRLQEALETGDESILDEPIVVPEVKVADTTKADGIIYQEIWKFRIINKAEVPEEYKIVDEKKVGAVVRAMKGNTNIPGIEVYPEKIVKAKA